jgi:hypothetical protein
MDELIELIVEIAVSSPRAFAIIFSIAVIILIIYLIIKF